MSDTKMSGERAREILLGLVPHGPMPVQPIWKGEENEAILLGAAAIEERGELVEALERHMKANYTRLDGTLGRGPDQRDFDLLVRHGRVIRDGDKYRWSDRR